MRLKKIKLAGFKSFVDPTSIPFPGDMTAVVGPNGCGKSNVIDAVRWVLGESSAKNLRGDAMTDVIFNGSSARKPVSQCSVELVFDNSSGRIGGEYANYAELSVKRIVTKEAVSSYLLNGSKCRRRDITDIFLGTGLGPRSYAIIEQGMISRLIESKPQELRVFIEEAAGISKYKERRKETLNRIGHTKDNLARLDDVRQGLSEQLAKLKRQAVAANRYKELKADERRLNAELATLRWLKQSELLKRSDDIIAEHQRSLDDLLSAKQGDASGLQALKNQQSIEKQRAADLQQEIYALGNNITKLEQSQLFARQRGQQIQAEIDQLEQQNTTLKAQLGAIEQELESNQQQVMESEPESVILQEQLDELQHSQDSLQDKSKAFAESLRGVEDDYYQQKQSLQLKHSQLQQTLSLQERTESRIAELKQERDEIQSVEQSEQQQAITEQEQHLNILAQQVAQFTAKQGDTRERLQNAKTALTQADEAFNACHAECIQIEAELKALKQLQSSDSDKVASYLQSRSVVPSWQAFHAQAGYEKALETALSLFNNAVVVDGFAMSDLLKENGGHGPQPLMLSQHFVSDKRAGSLASVIVEDKIPTWFNSILIIENRSAASSAQSVLQIGEILISKDGEIFTKDIYVSAEKATDGKILRSARIRQLQQDLAQINITHEALRNDRANSQENLAAAERNLSDIKEALNRAQSDYALLEKDIENARILQSERAQRVQRIEADIQAQQEALNQEQMRCELLSEEIEDSSIRLSELESQKFAAETDKQGLDVQLQALNSQLQQTQNRLHEQAMLSQRLQNSYQLLQEQFKSKNAQLEDNAEKRLMLQDEAENLLLPSDEQEQKLQDMLLEKEKVEHLQQQKLDELTELEEKITALEKGQVGIDEKVDRVKQQIESERLQAQTAKVKAQSFMEQLDSMKMRVKEVLDSLAEDADEKTHQQELEAVQASLSRLGAVNLAAVEEYDEQAQRKQHLDEQNEDLTQALETLENAMRKIDKETRTRFKHTFDQVNNDLKTLFPKVFGGGSAYLALTDDDLLDTGVTIMARPPGKKNSTIALLSGGEKALTALSLVFAIFRLNPAPFCLLDEVDAPLDDANVGRFCKLVAEMSKTVQFIYITHNKVAMEMATHLSGVTMAEPGVSRMVAVDMEQALAIAE